MRTRTRVLPGLVAGAMLLSSSVTTASAQQSLNLAYSIPGANFPFFKVMWDGADAAAAQIGGVQIQHLDGQDDDAKQLAGCESAIAQNVDGIVISPRTVDGLAGCFTAAAAANIPVMTVDRQAAPGTRVLGHVGADNVAGGREACQFIADRLGGQGRVIELTGTPGASPAIDRSKGCHDALANHSDIQIVASQTGNFKTDDALNVTENILTGLGSTPDNPGFDAMFSANDDMVMGALQALQAQGLDPSKFTIVGFDALSVALDAIEAGQLTATIDQYPNQQAATAVQAVVDYKRSGKTPAQAVTLLTPKVITAENTKDASTPRT
jgi:ribose transport system substrate-binding protein